MNVHADAGVSAQRNGTPERQMLCKITESFLARAIRALLAPLRLARLLLRTVRCAGGIDQACAASSASAPAPAFTA